MPDNITLTGTLPSSVNNQHFGPRLISYILYQYHHCQTTQPLLLEQLREWGIDISAGQINQLLIADKALFHAEKDAILTSRLLASTYVTVGDSGARHQRIATEGALLGEYFTARLMSLFSHCK